MSFLRNMDLYKAIVLLSFVALPAGGWWCHTLDEQILACNRAITDATKPGGLLEQIGSLQKKVEIVAQNSRLTTDATRQHRTYFEGQIIMSVAPGSGLKTVDFGISDPKVEPVPGQGQQKTDDYVVDVTWQRKDFTVGLDFVWAVVFNIESSAKGPGQGGQQSIWKLRELEIVNATDDKLVQNYKSPPASLDDKWTIRTMKFARREPRKGT